MTWPSSSTGLMRARMSTRETNMARNTTVLRTLALCRPTREEIKAPKNRDMMARMGKLLMKLEKSNVILVTS